MQDRPARSVILAISRRTQINSRYFVGNKVAICVWMMSLISTNQTTYES